MYKLELIKIHFMFLKNLLNINNNNIIFYLILMGKMKN